MEDEVHNRRYDFPEHLLWWGREEGINIFLFGQAPFRGVGPLGQQFKRM